MLTELIYIFDTYLLIQYTSIQLKLAQLLHLKEKHARRQITMIAKNCRQLAFEPHLFADCKQLFQLLNHTFPFSSFNFQVSTLGFNHLPFTLISDPHIIYPLSHSGHSKMSENPISVAGQKRKNEPTASSSSQDGGTPKKKKAAKPKKPLDSRFGGKTEEELMQLLLPDHLKPDLDIVFVSLQYLLARVFTLAISLCLIKCAFIISIWSIDWYQSRPPVSLSRPSLLQR